jgi:type III secretory pathway component EscU
MTSPYGLLTCTSEKPETPVPMIVETAGDAAAAPRSAQRLRVPRVHNARLTAVLRFIMVLQSPFPYGVLEAV